MSSVQGVEGLVGKEEVDDVADAGTHIDVSLPAHVSLRLSGLSCVFHIVLAGPTYPTTTPNHTAMY